MHGTYAPSASRPVPDTGQTEKSSYEAFVRFLGLLNAATGVAGLRRHSSHTSARCRP